MTKRTITLNELREERWEKNGDGDEVGDYHAEPGAVCYRDGAGDLRDVDMADPGMTDWLVRVPAITVALYDLLKCSHSNTPPCAACRVAGWDVLQAAGLVPR